MALSDNLVAYWKLNEESGDRADAHGSNTLSDNNTVLYGNGILIKAADFERNNSEYLSCADNADLSMGDVDFTLAAWIKLETLPSSVPDAYCIMSKDETANKREYRLQIGSDDKPGFLAFDDNIAGDSVKWGSAIAADTWCFIAGYHDAVNDIIGVSLNAGTPVTKAYAGGVADSGAAFEMGALIEGATTQYFDGLIDEVSVWKRVLTIQDLAYLYNGGYGMSYEKIVQGQTAQVIIIG